ncbi:unnamed protein product [Urochloa decumbens]|uniref:BHLH domain-containing protein n=1 Tax=Urochloa decumbens TaxID=240449 RepID=A0ABC9GEJ2_9POAL
MNYPGHDGAADPWCFPDDATAATAAGDTSSSFAAMLADYSMDNLFELAWEKGGGEARGAPRSTVQPPAQSSLWSPPPEVRFHPPSEDQMAAWLRTIVNGEELAFNDFDDGRDVAAKGSSDASTIIIPPHDKQNLPTITEEMGTKLEIKNPPVGGSSRRSHHGEAHNLTEKRRRQKINERLRTLQQLVPGCDKSNQASTLDQTIQYMKSLQHHVQEMSCGPARPAATAVPVVPPQYAPPGAPLTVPMMPGAPMVIAPAPAMIPFRAMLQMPQYPASLPLMVPAAAAPLYPAATPARATVAAEHARSSAGHRRHGSSRSKGKSSSSRRQKH